jgi:hypothetical protein
MSHDNGNGFFEKARGLRDSVMEDMAKLTLSWTSSHSYQTMNAAIAKPLLLLIGMSRKATGSAMADLLARLNMPSREDVLALSQRLTRIEMVLDDVGAGMDQFRRWTASQKQRPAAREREGNGEGRSNVTPLVKEG